MNRSVDRCSQALSARIALPTLLACALVFGAAGAPPAVDPSVLSGPVVALDQERSLVVLDFQGRLQKLDVRPEDAAISALSIDPQRRAMARQVVADRAQALQRHLVESIDLLREATDATRAGDVAKGQRLYRELYDRFDPTGSATPLMEPLAAVLSPQELAAVRSLVDSYWSALVEAEQRNSPKIDPKELRSRLAYEAFQTELRLAYEATLAPIQAKLERIAAAVEPTPEQRAAIRGAILQGVKTAGLRPTEEQRQETARAVFAALDEERRMKLLAAALEAL